MHQVLKENIWRKKSISLEYMEGAAVEKGWLCSLLYDIFLLVHIKNTIIDVPITTPSSSWIAFNPAGARLS